MQVVAVRRLGMLVAERISLILSPGKPLVFDELLQLRASLDAAESSHDAAFAVGGTPEAVQEARRALHRCTT
jgi:hypothetical protein